MADYLKAGCRHLEVIDEVQGTTLPMRLVYPTIGEERTERFGPYEMNVVMNAPVDGYALPLVVISHGGRATALTYRGMAVYLARSGFVVAMPEHMGDCRSDSSLSGKAENLENRPRHIRLTVDSVLADPIIGTRIARDKIAAIGHSMGGYTALAVAGGQPSAGPHETADGQVKKISVTRDPRIRALVLLAPGCAWFWEPGTLSGIDVPILLMTADQDEMAAHLHIDYIERDCDPGRIQRRVIAGAGHHAFQSPFPVEMTRPDFPPSHDPAGFDRVAFQPLLHAEILSFLRRI